MSDRPAGSASTFFDTAGRAVRPDGLRHNFGRPEDILRALGIPGEGCAEPLIAPDVSAALGLPAEAESAGDLPPAMATACFELHILSDTPQVVPFEVTVDLTTTPYNVLSGVFIFDSNELSQWKITQGWFGVTATLTSPSVLITDRLAILAEFLPISSSGTPPPSSVPWVFISGQLRPPVSYPGWFFNFGGGYWPQDTLFKGWQACS